MLTQAPASGSRSETVLRFLVCPDCGAGFRRAGEADPPGPSIYDYLICKGCGRQVPARGGVLRFVDADNYAGTFGFQWTRYRTTQLDSQTGLPISRARLFAATDWLTDLRGQLVLEAGSGAGRFTEVLLSTGAVVFSFDYSSAVEANWANNGSAENLYLFQADIFRIPLPPGIFDKVLCLGVLQHTPDPKRAFASLAQCVRPGGELVVDVYAKRLSALISWKYVLRPLTKRLEPLRLHALVERTVDRLLPFAVWLRRRAGRFGARLLPIIEYSHIGLPPQLNREWAILDTFDMYSPAHDHPQSASTLRSWFREAGFEGIHVFNGPNGVVGRGRCPN